MVILFYTTYFSVDLAHHEIFRAKVGKGGINGISTCKIQDQACPHTDDPVFILGFEKQWGIFIEK